MRIVIADDQPEVRKLLHRILSGFPGGVDIVGEASDGREVVELVSAKKPDVVIMDLQMPHIDGATATRAILLEHPSTAIVGFTSAAAEGVEALIKAGAVAVISKAKLPDLVTTLQNLTEDR
jgi:SARP family transcriptional regulator, regulator of embCAB operon